MTDDAPTLPVTVAIAPELLAATAASTQIRIEQELTEMLQELGLSTQPVVHLAEIKPTHGTRLIRLLVAGRSCRVPQTTIFEALAYVKATSLVAPAVRADTVSHLLQETDGLDPARLGELLGLVCRSVLSAQPSVLLPDSPLQAVLNLGMSIAACNQAIPAASLRDESIERHIAETAAKTIDVLINPDYLRALTSQDGAAELFPTARDALFVELGLVLPPLHFHPDSSLCPAGFAFRINGMRTMPRVGLEMGTILVNETTDRLAFFDVKAKPTINPETHKTQSVTSSIHKEMLKAAGHSTWDPFEYLILVFTAAIRRNAHAFLTQDVAASLLDTIGKAFPMLQEAAKAHAPPHALARVLRELLYDGVSIRNLPRILEILFLYETVPEADRDIDRVSFVRSGLADFIAFKAARGTNTIIAYLLDPKIEDAIADQPAGGAHGWFEPTLAEQIAAAVQDQLSSLPLEASAPVLLTRQEVRRPLRALLRAEFPQITILSFGDIPPHYNVQPVARIS
jgi:type III secretory pathway component EscV